MAKDGLTLEHSGPTIVLSTSLSCTPSSFPSSPPSARNVFSLWPSYDGACYRTRQACCQTMGLHCVLRRADCNFRARAARCCAERSCGRTTAAGKECGLNERKELNFTKQT